MKSIAKSWEIIEEVLREHAHSVYRALRKPASDAQIARLEKRFPARLPRNFRQSLKIHDGLRNSHLGPIRLFDYYALLPIASILTESGVLCALQEEGQFEGEGPGGDPRLDLEAHWRPGWVPIMDADGDKVVLDLDPAPAGTAGQVFVWSNSGSFPSRVVAPSFADWLAGLAEALQRRRFFLDETGSIWLERGPGD